MTQIVINTPASIYLYCRNIIKYGGRGEHYPTGRLFNDSCACIVELEYETSRQEYVKGYRNGYTAGYKAAHLDVEKVLEQIK